MKTSNSLLLSFIVLSLFSRPGRACTTFLLADGEDVFVGKSYDWKMGQGHAIFNKRGLAKQALPSGPGLTPAHWISKYASLSFNQFGAELPNSGMNEKGLVVEIMWLADSRFPRPDGRPMINELQWIQHILDTCADVDEAMAAAKKLNTQSVYAKVHYLACDARGRCAAFEYLDGKLVITPPTSMRACTLTNDPYSDSATFLARHRGFGGEKPIPAGRGSLQRFVRASHLSKELAAQAGDPVAEAFSILDSVSMGDYTKWNIVYDIVRRRVHFRARGAWKLKSVDLSAFDPSCAQPAAVLDMNRDLAGDVSGKFVPYDGSANRALVESSLRDLGARLPAGTTEGLGRLPESFRCGSESTQEP